MRIVLDTNIWLSAIFWHGEANKLLKKLIDKKTEIFITKEIILEISAVLNKEAKFQKYIKDKHLAIEDLLRAVISASMIISTKKKLYVIEDDPSDNRILECASEAKADYIISYDNHLLKLKKFGDIKIASPKEFLDKHKR